MEGRVRAGLEWGLPTCALSHRRAVGTSLRWAVCRVPRGSRCKALECNGGTVREAHPSCEWV